VRTEPRLDVGNLSMMREPRPGGGKRVACVSGSLDVDGKVERARSTDGLSDVSKPGTSTRAEGALRLSGEPTMSVAHVLSNRAPVAEPKNAGSPQERLRRLNDLLDAPAPSTASDSGPGTDYAESTLRQSVASVAIGEDWPGGGPPPLNHQAPRGALS
jgi:hypothetical protein